MTITAVVHTTGKHDHSFGVNDASQEAVRLSFNPAGLDDVTRLKLLACLYLTECDRILASQRVDHANAAYHEMAVAKTHMQTASMWAVLGATKGL